MKIILLVPAPANISPGQRFRFEHYLGLKDATEKEFVIKSFFSNYSWSLLHVNNHLIEKSLGVLSGFIKRFLILFTLYKYDFVYIYREAAPVGPPIFEWLIGKVFHKKIIYDFDDAIWVSAFSTANPFAGYIKCNWKVSYICKWSHIISVGNQFLAGYAKQFCKDVRIIPTVVNTVTKHNQLKNQDVLPLTIGWTGTFTNFAYLDIIIPSIKKLHENYNFIFLIIANKDPLYKEIQYIYKPWDVNTEIEDLLNMHIGVMPLGNTELELGKCAFKAIQYMSLGIPAVVSKIGANKDVVTDGANGYLADSDNEWYDKLEFLLKNAQVRTNMGKKAREFIILNYSVESTKKDFFNLF